jgi:hypothetical protein
VAKLNQDPLIQLIGVVLHLSSSLLPQAFFAKAFTASSVFRQIEALGFVFQPIADGITVAIFGGHGGVADEENPVLQTGAGGGLG